jgi:hypothetical protein
MKVFMRPWKKCACIFIVNNCIFRAKIVLFIKKKGQRGRKMGKLETLAEFEGFADTQDFCEAFVMECVVPGICSNPLCDYTCNVEPDSTSGYCEVCGTNTVVSCLVLAGVI